MTLENIDKNKVIHMIGIGGVSMSGIAEIVSNMGYHITGSDAVLSETTKRLESAGIKIWEGNHPEYVEGADLVVYSAAIKQDNPELLRAKELGIPTAERKDFLGDITKLYNETVAICGTHGKTTTTSMISLAFIESGKDPTIQVGADLRQLKGNYRIGNTPYFIVEACEYVESFLKFHPETVTLLNIEEDHLDYYKDLNHIKSAFKKFVELVPKRGFVIVNADDSDCLEVTADVNANIITFGILSTNADWVAKDLVLNKSGCYSFKAVYKDGASVTIQLHVPGMHNVYNALATIATSYAHQIDTHSIVQALASFTGAHRRFEYVGTRNGADIYDDYAHHPTEIKATIESANHIPHNQLWVVFQPHTYSRTASLFHEFATAFQGVDHVLLTDIYAAREIDEGLVSSEQLAIAINESSNNCTYFSKFDTILDYLKEHLKENDIILTIGAGTITKLGYELREDILSEK